MGNTQPVDVICQHSADGTIAPLRLRLNDENGEKRTFDIKGYKDLSFQGTRTMQDGTYVSGDMLAFECHIEVNNRRTTVFLYYSRARMTWSLGQKTN